MKQVECNKCGKMFEVEGEWGYCPFCENDNVEVKVGKSNGDFVDLLHLEMLELRLNLAQDKIKKLEKALAWKPIEIANYIQDLTYFHADVDSTILHIKRDKFDKIIKEAKEIK